METDGGAVHATRHAFEDDRVRDADLTLAGYTVVRFTWRRITQQPDAVADTLRRLLDARQPAGAIAPGDADPRGASANASAISS